MRFFIFSFFFSLFFGFICTAKAQFSVLPNHTKYIPQKSNNPFWYAHKNALQLPFFEDFSLYQGVADTNIFVANGGTYINQTFGINNPSLGVATFDGLNEQGQPYNFSTVVSEAIGLTDVLQCYNLNISTLSPADSLYMSFYYQKTGLGEMPDVLDSLVLQFKDNANNWVRVWSQKGGDRNTNYTQVLVPIKDAKYFYNAFQFRFQAYGRQSGMYDVWNVDYIYIDKNRNFQDKFVQEIATTKPMSGWLKKYTAMPAPHFWLNPTQYLAPSLKSTINNFSGTGFDVISYNATAIDAVSNLNLGVFASTTSFPLAGNAQQFEITANTNLTALPINQKLILKSQFLVSTGDNSTTIQGVDLTKNDIAKNTTYITDFFAYDDGTAEYGAGVNQRFGKTAIRFSLERPDTLTDIRLHFTKFEKDLSALSVNIVVWQQLANPANGINKDSVIYKVNVPIRYPNRRNELVSVDSLKQLFTSTFRFPHLRLPKGEFYIGWEQTTNDRVTVGYDMNNDATGEIFFNTGNLWQTWQPDALEKGAVMMRPIFSKDNLTALENFGFNPNPLEKNIILYPNPATDFITLEFLENANFGVNFPEKIQILDAIGREVTAFAKDFLAQENPNFLANKKLHISLKNHKNMFQHGIYLLKMDCGKGNLVTKKMVVR